MFKKILLTICCMGIFAPCYLPSEAKDIIAYAIAGLKEDTPENRNLVAEKIMSKFSPFFTYDDKLINALKTNSGISNFQVADFNGSDAYYCNVTTDSCFKFFYIGDNPTNPNNRADLYPSTSYRLRFSNNIMFNATDLISGQGIDLLSDDLVSFFSVKKVDIVLMLLNIYDTFKSAYGISFKSKLISNFITKQEDLLKSKSDSEIK